MYKIHENGIESECGKYVLENLEECLEELNHLLKERNELEMDILCADEHLSNAFCDAIKKTERKQ